MKTRVDEVSESLKELLGEEVNEADESELKDKIAKYKSKIKVFKRIAEDKTSKPVEKKHAKERIEYYTKEIEALEKKIKKEQKKDESFDEHKITVADILDKGDPFVEQILASSTGGGKLKRLVVMFDIRNMTGGFRVMHGNRIKYTQDIKQAVEMYNDADMMSNDNKSFYERNFKNGKRI